MTKKIVLIGGGFSEGQFPDQDDYLLSLARDKADDQTESGDVGTRRPKVCFIPTASGDAQDYIDRFYAAFTPRECEPHHLPLFNRCDDDIDDIDAFLQQMDIIYTGGGNTANMLAVWRVQGVDKALRNAYESGTIIAGISAGGCILFDACITDSFGDFRELNDGLGILSGSFCPHFDTEPGRQPIYRKLVAEKQVPAGIALDDAAALLFVDGELEYTYRSEDSGDFYRIS